MRSAAINSGFLLLGALFAARLALAGSEALTNDEQVTGLFLQSCMAYQGNAEGLRKWADGSRLHPLPDKVQDRFLNGLPGVAYDASNEPGKLVVVSNDDGTCSVVTEEADPGAVVSALERDLRDAGITFQKVSEKQDPLENALTHRIYDITHGDRTWSILVSTAGGEHGGQAMLTTSR
ncbi:MAG: hypothetical protein JOY71_20905 [Acetobacteraceae bacterium]|nr:hypothetical protein [Acetobacteraceae bacterium]